MDWTTLIKEYYPKKHHNTISFIPTDTHPDDICQTIVAMANGDGGTICIGLDQCNFHLRGVHHDTDWFSELINTQCSPSPAPSVELLRRNNKSIIIITVLPGNQKPYQYQQISFIRKNGITVAATPEEESLLKLIPIDTHSPPATFTPTTPKVPTTDTVNHSNTHQTSQTIPYTHTSHTPTSPDSHTPPKKYEPKETELNLSDRQLKALDHIKVYGSITNKAYRTMTNISHKTAHLELVDLVQKKLLTPDGSGRSTRYIRPKEEDIDENIDSELIEIQNMVSDLSTPIPPQTPSSPSNKQQLLISYLNQHSFISEQDYATLCRIPISAAIQELNAFTVNNILTQIVHNGRIFFQLNSKELSV